MFTIEQIDDLHRRLGRAETLPGYVEALAELGVVRYDSFVSDGHSEYFGFDDCVAISPPAHELLPVAADSDRDSFLDQLRRHEHGKTSYLEMSKGLVVRR
ncbi:MAG: hypothetical protein NVSMB4_13660 [Acidimicrobiales bacterium]